MPEFYYSDARKLAQKEFRACVSRGEYPYLPRLDDFVPAERIAQGSNLGTLQIPMEFVVGTGSGGRVNSFARNFMPLLEEGTEFSTKWKHLCKSHLDEGIRDPILVYEYMNRFYVEEGNKRVSVLKYFHAVTAMAQVIRILPQRNGTKEVELYYEFLEFYQYSGINILEFSWPGSYRRFLQLLGKEPKEPWTDEERGAFSAAYTYFRQAYEANGGARLAETVGDAMLSCIEVYGYQELRGKSAAEIRESVKRVWEEITLKQEEPPIDVKLSPKEEKDGSLLSRVLPKSGPKPVRAAFVHDKNPETSGWTYGHELGRRHVERVFPGELETAAYFDAMEEDPLAVIERAVAEGSGVIFTTSPRLLPASLRAAVDHPEVTILNCSLNTPHRYIRTYYARMYEVKFISGAVAGSLAGSNHVGYICDYPIFGQVAGINAFALGVQMTNPTAQVYLEWSSVGGVGAATKRLTERGIRLISSQDLASLNKRGTSSFGLSLVNEDGQVNLAMPVWQWGVYYEAILRSIRSKSFQAEYAESSKALNYYWGMSAGVVELQCSDKLPTGARRLAALLRGSICAGAFDPFRGPLYTQDGKMIAEEHERFGPERIINMDWLNENVAGSIPAYRELNEIGRATVDIVGIDPSTKEGQS